MISAGVLIIILSGIWRDLVYIDKFHLRYAQAFTELIRM